MVLTTSKENLNFGMAQTWQEAKAALKSNLRAPKRIKVFCPFNSCGFTPQNGNEKTIPKMRTIPKNLCVSPSAVPSQKKSGEIMNRKEECASPGQSLLPKPSLDLFLLWSVLLPTALNIKNPKGNPKFPLEMSFLQSLRIIYQQHSVQTPSPEPLESHQSIFWGFGEWGKKKSKAQILAWGDPSKNTYQVCPGQRH